MNDIVMYQYGNSTISKYQHNGYVNATQMCKAHGKLFGNYVRNKTTKEFLDFLSKEIGIPMTSLIISSEGKHGGTWVNPLVALHLAQWCSPKFAVWATNVLFEAVNKTPTSSVAITPTPTPTPTRFGKKLTYSEKCLALDMLFPNLYFFICQLEEDAYQDELIDILENCEKEINDPTFGEFCAQYTFFRFTDPNEIRKMIKGYNPDPVWYEEAPRYAMKFLAKAKDHIDHITLSVLTDDF